MPLDKQIQRHIKQAHNKLYKQHNNNIIKHVLQFISWELEQSARVLKKARFQKGTFQFKNLLFFVSLNQLFVFLCGLV